MTRAVRLLPDEDKLQKYRDYYAGTTDLNEEEKKSLDRYERVMLLFGQNEPDEAEPVWTRAAIVKFVRQNYHVSIQMSNRIVNEALELFGDMQQLSLRARKAFRLQHLERREKDAVAAGDHIAAARLNDQINKILGTYNEEKTTEEDLTDYSVPPTLNYEVIDVPYEIIRHDTPKPVAGQIPPSSPAH
ncbi:hypothetical protein P1X15_10050 [Runella sp. MFBS21]|uniref:hypothetical protein n=1 Tax=Runella sp. MFBS21 TaxID=3034018 RepID=UPI0023F78CB3|nr:hypothetical protein [Runella sp. MFBS21]MDF7817940.1 hypothetical protein [Runella sp. MFBS21]